MMRPAQPIPVPDTALRTVQQRNVGFTVEFSSHEIDNEALGFGRAVFALGFFAQSL